MVEQTTRAMTSSPVVCLIGETEALHFTPQSVSPSLTPTHHRQSFPHSYTSQRDLPSLLHITVSPSHTPIHSTVSPSLTPIHHNESFSHSYTSQRVLPSLLHITASPSLTLTHHSESFPHS
ncbi:hypothetical protein Hamer_G029722 [Homarus americanus]|uniref:Uncharacterized protein n=1 Tax=Homarus americanus TaxID=6706 RepID=A0A8J5KDT8_HOMAM|nr:hypothetical protein Hamer_G029722 [Homarus americanus]